MEKTCGINIVLFKSVLKLCNGFYDYIHQYIKKKKKIIKSLIYVDIPLIINKFSDNTLDIGGKEQC